MWESQPCVAHRKRTAQRRHTHTRVNVWTIAERVHGRSNHGIKIISRKTHKKACEGKGLGVCCWCAHIDASIPREHAQRHSLVPGRKTIAGQAQTLVHLKGGGGGIVHIIVTEDWSGMRDILPNNAALDDVRRRSDGRSVACNVLSSFSRYLEGKATSLLFCQNGANTRDVRCVLRCVLRPSTDMRRVLHPSPIGAG